MTHRCRPSLQQRTARLASRIILLTLLLAVAVQTYGQGRGRVSGVVRNASGAPVAGATVVLTNQTTSQIKRSQSKQNGAYSIQVSPGAYRLSVEPPYAAKFDKDKDYGPFTRARGDTLENVIVDPGKEVTIDIPLEETKPASINERVPDQPTGFAGKKSVASAKQTSPDHREARDRWRIGFPEYDRYGDRGARGRDIPFKRGRWWDPYNQSVLKGDYPIKGNKLFIIMLLYIN